MSEDIIRSLESLEEISPEKILSELLSHKKVEFHTEITNPVSLTALEVLAEWLKEFKLTSKLLKEWVKKFKVNMVAYERKRALEIVEAYKAGKEKQEEKTLKELLLGK